MSGEMTQFLAESLRESSGKIVTNGVSSEDSSPASSRRSGVGSMEEREIQAKIKILESQLSETKGQATEFQELLNDSNSHYSDLEKKYQKAKKMLKDYQDR